MFFLCKVLRQPDHCSNVRVEVHLGLHKHVLVIVLAFRCLRSVNRLLPENNWFIQFSVQLFSVWIYIAQRSKFNNAGISTLIAHLTQHKHMPCNSSACYSVICWQSFLRLTWSMASPAVFVWVPQSVSVARLCRTVYVAQLLQTRHLLFISTAKDYYVYFQAYFLWKVFSLAVILTVFTMIWGIWFCGNMLFLIQNQYELLFQRLTSSFLQIKVRRVARLIVCRKHNADNNVPGAVYIWNSVPVANGFGSWYLLLEVPGMSATDENPYFFV